MLETNFIELQWQLEGARVLPLIDNAYVSKCSIFVDYFPAKEWDLRLIMLSRGLVAQISRPLTCDGPVAAQVEWDICLLTAEGKRWRWDSEGKDGNSIQKGDLTNTVSLCSRGDLLDDTNRLFFRNYLTLSARLWYDEVEVPQCVILYSRSKVGVERDIMWSSINLEALSQADRKDFALQRNSKKSDGLKLSLFVEQDDVCFEASSSGTGGLFVEAVHIIHSNGQQVTCFTAGKFISVHRTAVRSSSNWVAFIKMQDLVDDVTAFLADGNFTLNIKFTDFSVYSTCGVQGMSEGQVPSSPAELLSGEFRLHKLAENISSLLDSDTASDLILKVGSKSFPVHKLVMCARSPVFDRMLQSGMLESTRNEIEVPDFSPESVRRLLRYVYSGDVPDLDTSNAMELYELADKYEVLDLRLECSRVLVSNLCSPYICRLVTLAYARSDATLKRKLLTFMSSNVKEVVGSPEWKSLKAVDPGLTTQVVEDLLMMKENN